MAKEGSVLLLLDVNGQWCHIQFQDPQYGLRTGYVEIKFVRIDQAASAPQPTRGGSAQTNNIPTPPASNDAADVSNSIQKSYSSKFFLGAGYEGNAIALTEPGIPSETDAGKGFGIILGYGFNPHFSLYGQLSGGTITESTGGTDTLAHFDVGTRVHFLAGPSRAVPFIQVGLSGRAVNGNFILGSRIHTLTASGTGASFGGGLNAHFTPAVAFSAGVTWSVGSFSTYQVDNVSVPGATLSAMSARIHLGLIWFAKAPSN